MGLHSSCIFIYLWAIVVVIAVAAVSFVCATWNRFTHSTHFHSICTQINSGRHTGLRMNCVVSRIKTLHSLQIRNIYFCWNETRTKNLIFSFSVSKNASSAIYFVDFSAVRELTLISEQNRRSQNKRLQNKYVTNKCLQKKCFQNKHLQNKR